MIKVVVTGVESTGKTVLAQSIGGYYKCQMVEEYARTYLQVTKGQYTQSDLVTILNRQMANEAVAIKTDPNLVVCDTGPYVIKVWSTFKYNTVDPKILQTIQNYEADLFILPDYKGIPYEEDPLRENPNDREILFEMYLKEMVNQDVPFLIVSGDFENRLWQVKRAVDWLVDRS
ncbi:MAG: ATP-binding protein [Bacteroidia bacterium]|nr:ATP-binding protein [Bacteroidia bacterium]